MTPGSCSTGIHILLEECDLVFEAWIINLLAGGAVQEGFPGDQSQGHDHGAC